jgi:hypothetical protein
MSSLTHPRSNDPSVPTHRASRRRLTPLAVALFIAVMSVACGQSTSDITSPVTEEQVVAMAENALEAFNRGDYAAWSKDWSDTMKSAIDESAFLTFREQYRAVLGDFVSIEETTGAPGESSGTYRWTFDIVFERADYRMRFGFAEGSPLIEGVFFEEPSA